MIELFPGKLFMLDDQMCQGFFTGDDFCDVSIVTILGCMAIYVSSIVLLKAVIV